MKVVYIAYNPDNNCAVRFEEYCEDGWGKYNADVRLDERLNGDYFGSIKFLDKPEWNQKNMVYELIGCEPEKLRFMPIYIHIPKKG